MAENSKIQWTDATWNPWHGCTKVSAGCKYCYMFRDKERYGQDPTKVIRSGTFNDPLRWLGKTRKTSALINAPQPGAKIFTCSWSDFFIKDADEWRADAWKIIKETPQFTYQILTKRPERINDCLPEDWDEGHGYPNVWIGVSVENQEIAAERMYHMCTFGAARKFLSVEPLLGQINLSQIKRRSATPNKEFYLIEAFDWVIVGGESGNDTGKYLYRECDVAWIEQIIFDCKFNEVPVFVKQLGTHLAKKMKLSDRHGGNMEEWPENLQIRQFPVGARQAY